MNANQRAGSGHGGGGTIDRSRRRLHSAKTWQIGGPTPPLVQLAKLAHAKSAEHQLDLER